MKNPIQALRNYLQGPPGPPGHQGPMGAPGPTTHLGHDNYGLYTDHQRVVIYTGNNERITLTHAAARRLANHLHYGQPTHPAEQVAAAYNNPGPHPTYHQQQKNHLRAHWPTLHHALTQLTQDH